MKTFLKTLLQKLKTFTKEVWWNIKQWFFIGISFLWTILIIGWVYAYTWIAPVSVNNGDTLTATAWNNMVNDLNYLKDEVTAISTGALLNSVYPIWSIYTSVSSTNPSTLFWGTWVAFWAWRVLVGRDSGQTEFDVIEETWGEKTHLLTASESWLPVHNHWVNDPWHSHNRIQASVTSRNSWSIWIFDSGMKNIDSIINTSIVGMSTNSPKNISYLLSSDNTYFWTNSNITWVSINNNTETNASSSHNNLQPYIVVYMWKRTG